MMPLLSGALTQSLADAAQSFGAKIRTDSEVAQIAPTLTDIQRAFDPVKYGQFSGKPCLDIQIPTLYDPTLAPKGKHLMSVSVKYIPYYKNYQQFPWHTIYEGLQQGVPGHAGAASMLTSIEPTTPCNVSRTHSVSVKVKSHGHMPELPLHFRKSDLNI